MNVCVNTLGMSHNTIPVKRTTKVLGISDFMSYNLGKGIRIHPKSLRIRLELEQLWIHRFRSTTLMGLNVFNLLVGCGTLSEPMRVLDLFAPVYFILLTEK